MDACTATTATVGGGGVSTSEPFPGLMGQFDVSSTARHSTMTDDPSQQQQQQLPTKRCSGMLEWLLSEEADLNLLPPSFFEGGKAAHPGVPADSLLPPEVDYPSNILPTTTTNALLEHVLLPSPQQQQQTKSAVPTPLSISVPPATNTTPSLVGAAACQLDSPSSCTSSLIVTAVSAGGGVTATASRPPSTMSSPSLTSPVARTDSLLVVSFLSRASLCHTKGRDE